MIGKKLNKFFVFTYYLFGDYVSFKRFFLNNFFSILSIYFFNYFFVNYSIPINLLTIFTYSFLGIPGFFLLFTFRFFIM